VLCALLSAAATGAWAARMGTRRAGAWAAVILVTSPQFYVHAHLAVADMPMILGFVAAGWCGWELLRPGHGTLLGNGWFWGWLAALAWGFLAKGPVAWLPVIPFAWARWSLARAVSPDVRLPRVRPLDVVAGVLVVLAIVGAWGIPALAQTQGEFWNVGMGKHVVARSVGVMEGHGLKGLAGYVGSLPFYFLALPIGFLPWSPWLFQRLRAARPWRSADISTRYLLGGAALVFVVFTVVRTKLPHYTLPAFPWIAVWLACELDRAGTDHRRFLRLAGGAALVLGLLAGIALPWASRFIIARDLQRVAVPLLQQRMAVATLGFQEPSIYWYLRPNDGPWVRHLQTEDEATRFLAEPGPRMIVVLGDLTTTASRLEDRFPGARSTKARGWNPVNGKVVVLRVIVRGTGDAER
jgi:4-amino-4-deoxy-L-arabinose transferase-like glycosyltransferase